MNLPRPTSCCSARQRRGGFSCGFDVDACHSPR
jgi:hypothetical protein